MTSWADVGHGKLQAQTLRYLHFPLLRSRKVSQIWIERIHFHISLLICYMCILQIEGFFWTGYISHKGFIFWWISWPIVVEEMMTVLASRTHGLFLRFQFKQASLYVWLRVKLATPHLVWHRSQNLSLETRDTWLCAGNGSPSVHALPHDS